jgi:hypothetical protein
MLLRRSAHRPGMIGGVRVGKFPGLIQIRPDSVGPSSIRPDEVSRSPQCFFVSYSLAEDLLFAGYSNVANLAYWVTGTEGSNPSLSANESLSLRTLPSRRRNSARLRLYSDGRRHRRRAPSGSLRAERGRFLCWRVRRFHPRPTHDRIKRRRAWPGWCGSDRT